MEDVILMDVLLFGYRVLKNAVTAESCHMLETSGNPLVFLIDQ